MSVVVTASASVREGKQLSSRFLCDALSPLSAVSSFTHSGATLGTIRSHNSIIANPFACRIGLRPPPPPSSLSPVSRVSANSQGSVVIQPPLNFPRPRPGYSPLSGADGWIPLPPQNNPVLNPSAGRPPINENPNDRVDNFAEEDSVSQQPPRNQNRPPSPVRFPSPILKFPAPGPAPNVRPALKTTSSAPRPVTSTPIVAPVTSQPMVEPAAGE